MVQAVYFLSFILFSTYYGLNLFVGVIVNNFTRLNREMTGRALLTATQQRWRETERLIHTIKVRLHIYASMAEDAQETEKWLRISVGLRDRVIRTQNVGWFVDCAELTAHPVTCVGQWWWLI